MASTVLKLFLLTSYLALILSTESTVMARSNLAPKSSLAARLNWDDSTWCWDSLLELHACSGEVIMFFLNGETNLGPVCCQAIRTIEHHCWPSMLGSLGFTPEEGDILEGYCDAKETSSSSPPPPQFKGTIN